MFLVLNKTALSIDENNTRLAGPYFTAFVTGLATKGISDLKLFDIRHAGESFPIGIKTFFHVVDRYFDKECDSICFDRILRFMRPYWAKYESTNLLLFKDTITEVMSSHPSQDKIDDFLTIFLIKASNTKEVLNTILREFGKRTLQTISDNVPARLACSD